MKHDILYLGSQSSSRQAILQEAQIPFKIVEHQSDEVVETPTHDFNAYVLSIARHKMAALLLPDHEIEKNHHIFVLTADSLIKTLRSNQIFGKPADERDAKRMLRLLRDEPVDVATACCVEKKIWDGVQWKTIEDHTWVSNSIAEFIIEDDEIDLYLKKVPAALGSASAAIIEGFGQNFFKSINGSYTGARGLPVFEVRQTLKSLGFRF